MSGPDCQECGEHFMSCQCTPALPCCKDYYPELECDRVENHLLSPGKLCDDQGNEILCICGNPGNVIAGKDWFLVMCPGCQKKSIGN